MNQSIVIYLGGGGEGITYMFYFVKDVIKLGFTQSLNLNLDKRYVGQYTRQCAFIQFYNLFTRQCILSTVSARDTFSPRREKHTINHRLILVNAFR